MLSAICLGLLVWFGTIVVNSIVHGRGMHVANLVVFAGSAATFAYSMGWLR